MVNNKTIDARILSRMFLAGAKNLEAKKEWINELNVFPVPDGDTGTNMTMTIMSAAAEVSALTDPDMETLAKAISSGSLRGARGNSGVILSQLLRGFTKSVKKAKELDALAVAEYQADIDEATEHLTAAINALVKVDAGTPSGSEESDNTTEAGTSDTSVSDVKTGDADNMAVYSLAALLALAAGVAVVSRRRIKDVR